MNRYLEIFLEFIKLLARSRVSMAGSVVATLIFPVLIVSIFLDMQGVVNNPYFAFLIYMVMGPLFLAGLATVAVGVLFFKDHEEIGIFTIEYIREQLTMPGRFIRIRRLIYFSTGLFLFTATVIWLVSYTGFKYTETTGFCGQFCHSVMEPEYITYQNSPHSRIACVDCHISGSSDLVTRSKMSGLKMIYATVFDDFERPLKNPEHPLRPSREVCEQCHRPEVFHGDKLYIKDIFLPDEHNTHVQTVLLMRVGAGGFREHTAGGIHWHVSPTHQVYYQAGENDDDPFGRIKLIDHDGSTQIFDRQSRNDQPSANTEFRLMDCMDCHNRPTHVFLSPGEALDRKMSVGVIPRDLPFIKKVALEVIQVQYPDKVQARKKIAATIEAWYRKNEPEVYRLRYADLEKAANGAFKAWSENVFPQMAIGWGTYQSNIGHRDDEHGCFRCHQDDYKTEAGREISSNCDLCHYILADREPSPDIMQVLHGGGLTNR